MHLSRELNALFHRREERKKKRRKKKNRLNGSKRSAKTQIEVWPRRIARRKLGENADLSVNAQGEDFFFYPAQEGQENLIGPRVSVSRVRWSRDGPRLKVSPTPGQQTGGGFNSSKIVRGKTTPENEEGRNERVQASRKKLELFPPRTARGNKESYPRWYRVVSSSSLKNPKKFSTLLNPFW